MWLRVEICDIVLPLWGWEGFHLAQQTSILLFLLLRNLVHFITKHGQEPPSFREETHLSDPAFTPMNTLQHSESLSVLRYYIFWMVTCRFSSRTWSCDLFQPSNNRIDSKVKRNVNSLSDWNLQGPEGCGQKKGSLPCQDQVFPGSLPSQY